MAFSCSIEAAVLQGALRMVQPFVPRSVTIPVVGSIRITVADGTLRLMGTDLDNCITHTITDVEHSGEIDTCLDDGALFRYVNSFDGNEILTIRHGEGRDDYKIIIESGDWSGNFVPVADGDDFPDLEFENKLHSFTMPPFFVRGVIDRIGAYVSNEETRYYLNGIYLHECNGNLRAVATDGKRLAWIDTAISAAPDMGILINKTLVRRLGDLADECCNAEFSFNDTGSKCQITFGNTTIVSRLIDGTFPDYTRLIPTLPTIDVKFKTRHLRGALDKLAQCLPKASSGTIKLEKSAGKVSLSYTSPDGVTLYQEIEASGEEWPGHAGFNLHYLKGIVRAHAGLETTIKLPVDENYQGFCHAAIINSEADPLNTLLMPMRV